MQLLLETIYFTKYIIPNLGSDYTPEICSVVGDFVFE